MPDVLVERSTEWWNLQMDGMARSTRRSGHSVRGRFLAFCSEPYSDHSGLCRYIRRQNDRSCDVHTEFPPP